MTACLVSINLAHRVIRFPGGLLLDYILHSHYLHLSHRLYTAGMYLYNTLQLYLCHILHCTHILCTQSGRRNRDGLVAHRRATSQPTDGLLHLRLKIDNFLRIRKVGTPLILNSRDMMRMFREKNHKFYKFLK